MYYFYVLRSKRDKNLYYGITSDLKKRFIEHNTGKVRSNRRRRPLELIYYEAYLSKKDARGHELLIKKSAQQREILKDKIKNSLMNQNKDSRR